MGLDLILENRNKAHYGNNDWHELAYGRKTWTIADFFRDRNEAINGDWVYHVTRKSWDEFIATVHPYATNANFLKSFDKVFDDNGNQADYQRMEELIDKLSNDGWVQISVAWEVSAILRWYNANFEVQEAFNRGDEIRLIVSY